MWSSRRRREREAARLEGEVEYPWNAARLEVLTVYIDQVEKIAAEADKQEG